jgi:hypothetical protein
VGADQSSSIVAPTTFTGARGFLNPIADPGSAKKKSATAPGRCSGWWPHDGEVDGCVGRLSLIDGGRDIVAGVSGASLFGIEISHDPNYILLARPSARRRSDAELRSSKSEQISSLLRSERSAICDRAEYSSFDKTVSLLGWTFADRRELLSSQPFSDRRGHFFGARREDVARSRPLSAPDGLAARRDILRRRRGGVVHSGEEVPALQSWLSYKDGSLRGAGLKRFKPLLDFL